MGAGGAYLGAHEHEDAGVAEAADAAHLALHHNEGDLSDALGLSADVKSEGAQDEVDGGSSQRMRER